MGTPSRAETTSSASPETSVPRERIHVVFSIDTMSVGGTEMNAVRTAERLDHRRFRLTVVTLRGEGPLAERYQALGIPVVRFPIYNLYGTGTIKQAFRLARFLREEQVKVVHCHDQYSNFFSTMSARLAGVPVVIASKRWLHSTLTYRIANGIGFRAATRVLANSESVANSLRTDDHLGAKRIVVIPNFVDDRAFERPSDMERARWRSELALEDDALVVGIIASLLPIKDHATLLRAAAQLAPSWPTLRVVIVGQGPELEPLRELARTLGVGEIVRFAGLRPQVPSFHFLFDVSVLCSVSEGFPNSLVEAMAAGRPIVATDVGGVRDAVRDGENGLLVPPRDPAALASSLGSLLASSERRSKLGAAGEQRARREFHAGVVVGSLEQLYDRLLTRQMPPDLPPHA